MTTANDLITRAFRRGRIIGEDDSPGAGEAADALSELNDLMDEWWNDKLYVFSVKTEAFTISAQKSSYTIGSGGDFNTTRPVKIVPGSRISITSTVERALTVLTNRKDYEDIPNKAVTASPQVLYYDPAFPLGTVFFYPTPDQTYTVNLDSWTRLQSFAGLATAVSLPPGYNRLIVNGLAMALCPEYGLEPPASVVRAYNGTKRRLELVNYELPVLGLPSAVLPRRAPGGSILTGDTW